MQKSCSLDWFVCQFTAYESIVIARMMRKSGVFGLIGSFTGYIPIMIDWLVSPPIGGTNQSNQVYRVTERE